MLIIYYAIIEETTQLSRDSLTKRASVPTYNIGIWQKAHKNTINYFNEKL